VTLDFEHSLGSSHNLANFFDQSFELIGFLNKPVDPHASKSFQGFTFRIPTGKNDGYVLIELANFLKQFPTVHDWHGEI